MVMGTRCPAADHACVMPHFMPKAPTRVEAGVHSRQMETPAMLSGRLLMLRLLLLRRLLRRLLGMLLVLRSRRFKIVAVVGGAGGGWRAAVSSGSESGDRGGAVDSAAASVDGAGRQRDARRVRSRADMWIDASERAGGEARKAFLPVTTVRLRSAGLATARDPHARSQEWNPQCVPLARVRLGSRVEKDQRERGGAAPFFFLSRQ